MKTVELSQSFFWTFCWLLQKNGSFGLTMMMASAPVWSAG